MYERLMTSLVWELDIGSSRWI